MTREQATNMARRAARARREDHSYLPQTMRDAETWTPHEWVVDAILAAHEAGMEAQRDIERASATEWWCENG